MSFWDNDDRPPMPPIDAKAQLIDWMVKNKITNKLLAYHVNCSPAFVSRFLNGQRGIGWELAQRIESYTRGHVSAHALCTAHDKLKSSQRWRKKETAKRTVFEELRDEDLI